MFSFRSVMVAVLGLGMGMAQVVSSLPIHYEQTSFDTAFHISTPDVLNQCTPALFAWTPTSGPYYLTTTSPYTYSTEDVNDAVVIPHATSASWIVDLPEGSRVIVQIKDSEGRVAETMTRIVGSGPSHCL